MAASRRKAPLGRNLDALLGKARDRARGADEGSLRQLPLESIRPGRFQPRSAIDPDRLEELVASIKAQGVVQPVVVRPIDDARGYELIAGERRWRAAGKAGLERIPAMVRQVADDAVLAMSLIENIQREDLNPLEEAGALKRLIGEFDLTHEQAAKSVGRSRAAVTNLLRLLELAPEARELVAAGRLDMGHARALLALERSLQAELARRVVDLDLSVRQTEALVKRIKAGVPVKKSASRQDPDITRLEAELTESLCAPVSLKHSATGKGSLTIRYNSLDELDGILDRLRRS